MTRDEINKYQKKRLESLLLHAYKNVPYYHRILPESGVISGERVDLGGRRIIKKLTKDIIRKEGKNLYSSDYLTREHYENSSGGSTGEPVRLIQDKQYNEWNIATKIHFNQMLDKEIGERELKFWGSDRDIIKGSIGIKNKLNNWLYNRHFINSILLTQDNLNKIVTDWNKIQPDYAWCYLSSVFELARYMDKHDRTFSHPPKAVIVTTAVLLEPVREYIQKILRTHVYNQYGSREVGVIACECPKQDGLHIFDFFQYVEIIDADNSGNGEVIITNLCNLSMPLIRYQIGDKARRKNTICSCGLESHMLENITGRTTDHFLLKDGTKIDGLYFYLLFLFIHWIRKYQVIQRDYESVLCRIVPDGEIDHDGLKGIEQKIQKVMGNACEVHFEFVKDIEYSKSGKYNYVLCDVNLKIQ
jgi:phenylacetate-CoA ligase